ncbi:MAG: hypothetical protein ACXWX5_00915 [Actinomycetota bacterium]
MDDPLAHEPFSFRLTKDGRILISFDGRVVTTVAGKRAEALASKLGSANAHGVQQLLARATGNFKRGNERGEG